MFTQEQFFQQLSTYTHEPLMVYSTIILVLTASSFGLPIPEEITLISAGIMGYLARQARLFESPTLSAQTIDPWTLALVCFCAVLFSDILVYWIGRVGGRKIRSYSSLEKFVTNEAFTKVEQLTRKHGAWMAGVFRFTPGLRFPGHLTCGMMGLSFGKFLLVDGTAALLTVPTQVLFVSYYGEFVVEYFKQFKIIVFVILLLTLGIYFFRRSSWMKKFWIG